MVSVVAVVLLGWGWSRVNFTHLETHRTPNALTGNPHTSTLYTYGYRGYTDARHPRYTDARRALGPGGDTLPGGGGPLALGPDPCMAAREARRPLCVA